MQRACLLMLLGWSGSASAVTWSQVLAQSDWDTLGTKKHAMGTITIYHAMIGGVNCFSATANTSASTEQLLTVAADIESAKRWSSAGVTEAKVLSRNGSNIDYYQYLDVPGWTLTSDRFWFLRGRTERDGSTVTFRWSKLDAGGDHAAAYNAVKAAHPSAVEPPINLGAWQFSVDGDASLVTYYVCTDSGGSIPVALQTAATRKTLPDTVGDLIKEAKRR